MFPADCTKKANGRALMALGLGLALCIAGSGGALASSDLMSGMSAYQAKDYKTAKAYFQRAVQSAPEDSLAHYYLGNTLLKLKDPTGAKKEYQAGSSNAETDDVKNNCDKAIESLAKNDKTQTVKAGPSLGTGSSGATASGGGGNAGAPAGNSANTPPAAGATAGAPSGAPSGAPAGKTAAVEAVPEVPLTQLQKHALMEKDLLKKESEAAQKQLLDNAAQHAKSIEENTKRATDMSDMNYRARARNQAYFNELKNQGEKQRSQALDYGKSRAADAQRMQEEKSRSIDEVVNNLNDQMNSKVGSSKIHLKPEGTSIYIRNYGQ